MIYSENFEQGAEWVWRILIAFVAKNTATRDSANNILVVSCCPN